MKTTCEACNQPLPANGEVYICAGQSTFCPECAANTRYLCPDCGGDLLLNPTRGSRSWLIWALSFSVWSVVAFAAGVTVYRLSRATSSPMAFTSSLGIEFCQILTYAPLTPFAFAFALRYPIRRNNWIRLSLMYMTVGLVFTAVHVALQSMTPFGYWDPGDKEWRSVIWNPHTHALGVQWSVLPEQFLTSLFNDIGSTFVPIALVAHIVCYNRTLRDRELHAAQLEGRLAKARLQALKSQLQPHFLFNTMHSISALMLIDPKAADRMMTRLGDLLRMSLESAGTQITTLSREIEFVNCYLEIEKVRFAERLHVTLDISPETLDASVPHLLLQPLVDNAVKHGISRLPDGGEIKIVAKAQAKQLQIEILDNGPGVSDKPGLPSSGLGLRITRERLESLYGQAQRLDLLRLSEGGTMARVCIPLRTQRPEKGHDSARIR